MTGIESSKLSRRHAAVLCAGAGLLAPQFLQSAWAQAAGSQKPMLSRAIPKTGEKIPVVGLGTITVFDVGDDAAKRAQCAATVRALVAGGGTLIDTAESYSTAEAVIGDIFADTGLRKNVFLATKLDIEDYQKDGLAAMRGSLQRLKTDKVDLMQFHNVRDPKQDLGMLRDWKAQGLCRYTGITTTSAASYDATVAILEREKPDFLLIDYALDKRDIEARVLPAATAVGAAVVIALPFGKGRLFKAVQNKPLPEWAAEFDCTSWAQFFLKYVLGNPAVTVVSPGTSNPDHMMDDLTAGRGRMPDEKQRAQMVQYVGSLG